jgi:signal transduction histidine kinase
VTTQNSSVGRWRPAGLAARLFLAQVLVVMAGAVTVWVLVAAVGPPIFRVHLKRALGDVDPVMVRHVEEAFQSATALSITVAVFAALIAAVLVSIVATRRIVGPVNALADAADQVASGRYAVRVIPPGLGGEFARLADAFNVMAARLDATEGTRRRLLADLAHEMRTPVATLDAYLEGLQDGVATLDDKTVGVLRAQTSRLARLAEDIAAVSRVEERQLDLHLAPTDPGELVRAATAGAADRFAAKGVALVGNRSLDVPRVIVDRERIGQVLGNLLDNALRHTPAGGTVTVASRLAEPGWIALSVTDTGEGIPAEHLCRIFERFYRVDSARDRPHGGSGIGLAIAKALVDAHGGRITATSPGPRAGATFTILLPAA